MTMLGLNCSYDGTIHVGSIPGISPIVPVPKKNYVLKRIGGPKGSGTLQACCSAVAGEWWKCDFYQQKETHSDGGRTDPPLSIKSLPHPLAE
jgi:hypothetical protein